MMQKKYMVKTVLTAVMSAVLILTSVLPVRAAEVSEVKALQQEILDYATEESGGKTLLSGKILDEAGSAYSDWLAFGYARSKNTEGLDRYLGNMKLTTEALYAKIGAGDTLGIRPSDIARLAIIVKALGENPESFGKDASGNPIDLVKDSSYDCILGDVGKQGNNGYIWALLALDACGAEPGAGSSETRESLVQKLLSSQNEDGGFGLTNGDASDPDLTAMTITALYPYHGANAAVDACAERAFAWLSGLQCEDGTMKIADERTSETTAWTILAASTWGKDLNKEFVAGGKTLLDGIACFKLEDGSYIHSLDAAEPETKGNPMSCDQVYYGLEALRRSLEGEPALFDMSDAPKTTAKEAAGGKLPIVPIAVGGGAVLLVLVLLITKKSGAKPEKTTEKKKSSRSGKDPKWEDDEDDEW